jgi:WD40 repeat protein
MLKLLKKLLFFAFVSTLSACDTTPKPEKTISLAANGVFSASLSENFALLGTVDGSGELWDIKGKPSLIHQWKHTDENTGILATDISPSEEFAITAEKDSIAWWRVSDGTLLTVWSLPNISSISISPDGQFALVGLSDKAIYLALQYGKTLYSFTHEDRVLATDISTSGLYALTGSEDKTAKLWDLSSGELKHTWQHRNKLSTVALSHNDKYALTNAALSQTRLWKITTGKLHKEIGPKLITLSSAEFSNNSKFLLIGHITQRIDLWKVNSGKLLKFWRPKKEDVWRPTAATIMSLRFTANDKKFYSLAANGFLQKWRN